MDADSLEKPRVALGEIEYLPEEIGQLKELENLELTSKKLQKLPNEIVSLSRLLFLELTDSQITELRRILAVLFHCG